VKPNEIRDMSDEEIRYRLRELRTELMWERARKEQLKSGYTRGARWGEGHPNRYAMLRKDIARMETILRERELKNKKGR